MSNQMEPPLQYSVNSLATTNGALIHVGPTYVTSMALNNASAAPKFVRFYDKATAPTVGTDIPVLVVTIPASASFLDIGGEGFRFNLGLGISITGAAPANDSTAVAAGDVQAFVSYC